LDALIAVPGKYHGFFSFPVAKGGYSGVAVYTKSTTVVPLRAEEGLSGCLQPKPPLSNDERVSANYPAIENVDLMADDDGGIPNSLVEFDKEGRALVLDFGLFVLINLYCVADSGDTRYHYKMNYYYLLQERVRILVEEGREVIVVGDLNSCPAPIDHCEGMLPKHKDSFSDYPHRAWLRDWMVPNGLLVDTTRERWPDREGMYTCGSSLLFPVSRI
jgi:AP endonuclease 2